MDTRAMKKILLAALLWAPIAAAQVPTIVGHVPNRAGSKITFTTDRGSCKENQFLAYTQNDGGRVGFLGCYRIIDSEIFVVWSDGDVYTYEFSSLVFSREFLEYVERGGK